MKSLKIVVLHGNREESVYIHDLEELSSWIDDFSTDHCEGISQLYMFYDGSRCYVPVKISCEEGDV